MAATERSPTVVMVTLPPGTPVPPLVVIVPVPVELGGSAGAADAGHREIASGQRHVGSQCDVVAGVRG